MTVKEISKKLVLGGSVSLASVGLTTCSDDGAVDPAPPPLVCGEVGAGQTLTATGTLDGAGTLTVKVTHAQGQMQAWWDPKSSVQNLVNATLVSVAPESTYSPVLVIQLAPATGTTSGTFLLDGALLDYRSQSCPVRRTFGFSIGPSGVQVTERGRRLPLGRQREARIELVQREGRRVELRALGAAGGRVGWSVSGGELALEGGRVLWNLPDEAGLYQAELLVEHGEDGLAFDTLVLEVG